MNAKIITEREREFSMPEYIEVVRCSQTGQTEISGSTPDLYRLRGGPDLIRKVRTSRGACPIHEDELHEISLTVIELDWTKIPSGRYWYEYFSTEALRQANELFSFEK